MHWSKGRVFSAVIAAMFVAGIGLGISCSKRSGDVAAVANPEYVQPVGHVQGKIVDQCSDLSLGDVEISIAIKGKIKSMTTDDNGLFAFANLPAGGAYPSYGSQCYVVVANFEKYNKKQADQVKSWNKKNPSDLKTARPYPDTVEGQVCLHYEWIESANQYNGSITYTGSGAATVVDGLVGEVILYASKPVGTVVGEAYWGKDKSPASGVTLNLYNNSYGTLEGQSVVGADGTYQFSMVHECQSYTIAPAKPCFEYSTASSGIYTGSSFEVLATQLSDPEGDLAVTNVKCIEMNPIPCVDDLAPCLIASDPKPKMDITDAGQAITLTFSELMDESIPVKEEVEILFTGYKALTPPSVDFDYAWSTAVVNMEGYPTAQTVSILTLTPTTDLMLGMKYDIKLVSGGNLSYSFQDLAGNAYSASSVVCNGDDLTDAGLIHFTTNYGGTCPTVTNLAQVVNTANAVNQLTYPGGTGPTYLDQNGGLTGIQAPVLNTDYWNPAIADVTAEYGTDQAVLSWTAPGNVTNPVRLKGYRLYVRVNPLDVWTQVANEAALGPYINMWPAKSTITTNNLTAINTILSGASLETLSSINWGYDKTGNAAQTLEMAVTTVNADGYECPEITSANSITLKDNTVPMVVRNNQFSVNPLSRDKIDTAYFASAGPAVRDSVTLSSLVYPDSVLGSWDQGLMACKYGDLPLAIPILEDVNAATVSGVTFVNTSANADQGVCQLTFCAGWYTEPNDATDGTLVQTLGPKLVSSKGKNFVVLVWNDAYKLDTGDRLIIPGVRDIAGNTVPAYSATTGVGGGWVHVVDDLPPMMKSVKANPATDTLTIVTTEEVPAGTNQANIALWSLTHFTHNTAGAPQISTRNEDLAFGSATVPDNICADGLCNGYSVATVAGSDESVVTIYMDDVSYIVPLDYICMNNLTDNDWKDSTRAYNASTDCGSVANNPGTMPTAYWYGKPDEPGAYDPDAVSGLGTSAAFTDLNVVGNVNRAFGIGPRVSVTVPTVTTTGTCGGAGAWYNAGEPFTVRIRLTENVDASMGATAANSPLNPANYQIIVWDCANNICSNDGTETPTPSIRYGSHSTVTQNVATYAYDVTGNVPSVAGHCYEILGVDARATNTADTTGSTIAVRNLQDARGNVMQTTRNNAYIYTHNAANNTSSWMRGAISF